MGSNSFVRYAVCAPTVRTARLAGGTGPQGGGLFGEARVSTEPGKPGVSVGSGIRMSARYIVVNPSVPMKI
jgi:hypothetical protein